MTQTVISDHTRKDKDCFYSHFIFADFVYLCWVFLSAFPHLKKSSLFADLVRTASLFINPHTTKQVGNISNLVKGKKPGTLEVVVF